MNYYFDNKELFELYDKNIYILNINYFLKISIFLLLLSVKYIILENKIIVNIDNNIDEKEYEKNINFSEYTTDIKIIAMYHPNYQCIQVNFNKTKVLLNEWTNINKAKPLFESHHQPRKPGDIQNYLEYYNLSEPESILKQIELAKSHGIYGFGIYYFWFSGKKLFEKAIDIFLEYKNINFPFFLIWRNDNFKRNIVEYNNTLLIKQNYNKFYIERFIKDIKKYLISENYIKFDGKPLLGINDVSKIPNLKKTILILREKAKILKIGEIFILAVFNKIKDEIAGLLDGFYELPPTLYYKYQNFRKNIYYYYYSTLLNNLEVKNKSNNIIIFKGNIIEWDNTPTKKESIIYNEYSPLKFYNSNKILINWINKNLNSTNKFFFINSWNNWLEGSYLEPDENYGYASLNALSKALFNLAYDNKQYNLLELTKESNILALIQIVQGDKINDIINKTNNIPVKFDLLIISSGMKKILEEQIAKFSKANLYEIFILKSKEKVKLPKIIKLKKRIKYYKYFVHLHYKESENNCQYKNILMKYLYQNLLGTNEIVSKILTDFENNDHLGFIYPENFYFDKKLPMFFSNNIKSFINSVIKRISPGYIVGNNFKYPLGNMFWARVNAVYQIFENRFINLFLEETQTINNETIKNEIIWLYLVKINGYYYKTIFNSF